MHIDVSPRRFDLQPGIPQPISVTISNTSEVIGGYTVRILGADPSWVVVDESEISLFPDESRTVTALITVPTGMTAGERRFSVQVRELTPPEESIVEEIAFSVPEAVAAQVRIDPMAITAGRTAKLSVLLDNTGNTTLRRRLHGQDPEGRVKFRFSPPVVELGPGEHALVDLKATAKQPFLGNPVVRPLEFRLLDPDFVAAAAPPPAPSTDEKRLTAPSFKRRKAAPPLLGDEVPLVANATFIQKPMVSRGPISLLGLLVAVTVFAIVITVALSRIVGQSAADRNLALEIAAAREAGSTSGTSGVSGTVTLLTSGSPVPGVSVTIFPADDTEAAIATAATGDDGTWSFARLGAGDYKVTFRGAGFTQLWYPQALDAADAEVVTLEATNTMAGLDVALGGVPATISGSVTGADVSAATLTLKSPLDGAGLATTATGSSGTTTTPAAASAAASTAAADEGATVMSVPIGDDGTFTLENVPSPSVYDLVVEKQGYATSTQRIDVSAGEERTGVEITLRQGDGLISGTISSAGEPLAGATVVATSGQTTVTTMTLTEGDIGSFTLRNLPTPASFTVVVSLEGYAPQTLQLGLGEGQQYTGVDLSLDASSGSLSGSVTTASNEQPAGGVLVAVTDGTTTVQTATASTGENPGSWTVSGLTLPGDYTVTFSRADLASQTVRATLDGQGNLIAGQGSGGTDDQIDVSLSSSTAIVEGTVTQKLLEGGTRDVGEVTVSLTSDSQTYTVTTASVPSFLEGTYRIEGIVPDTYTLSISRNGVTPVSKPLELNAGQISRQSTTLEVAASLSGEVVIGSGADAEPAQSGWIVELYRTSGYPGTLYRETKTLDGGTFSFEDIDAPEAYRIVVKRSRGGEEVGSRTVQVTASQPRTVVVRTDD